MKTILVLFLAVILAPGLLLAQETPPPPGTGSAQQPVPPAGQQPATPAPPGAQTTPTSPSAPTSSTPAAGAKKMQIAPGSVIPVQLTKTVDAKKVKKGDEVVAKVTQDLQATSGQVIVPKDTKVVGHVTEAQKRSKEQKESQLAISFDRVDIKGGEPMQLPMSIQAIIAPPNPNPSNDNNPGGSNQEPTSSPSAGTAAASGGYGGRGAMGGNAGSAPAQPSAPENSGNAPSQSQNSAAARPQITGETRGVVGISNLTLAAAPDASQGSVVTSEKNNVKLEDGTFMLLKVNPDGAQSPVTTPPPQNPQK